VGVLRGSMMKYRHVDVKEKGVIFYFRFIQYMLIPS
jgi:hypothetical protein